MKKTIFILLILFCSVSYAGVDFDGTDDYLAGGNFEDYEGQHLTMAAWIKAGTQGGDYGAVMGQWSDTSSSNRMMLLAVETDGTVVFLLQENDPRTIHTAQSTGTVDDDTWHHVACTWDQTTMRVYIDGDADGTQGQTETDLSGRTVYGWTVGNLFEGGLNGDFNGEITEVYTWRGSALDAQEIAILGKSKVKRIGMTLDAGSLNHYWPLDELADGISADGSTFNDLVGGNGIQNLTGNDGANNTGLTALGESVLTYP